MCTTCGCSEFEGATVSNLDTGEVASLASDRQNHGRLRESSKHRHLRSDDPGHPHEHSSDHSHTHDHGHPHGHDHVHGGEGAGDQHSHTHEHRSREADPNGPPGSVPPDGLRGAVGAMSALRKDHTPELISLEARILEKNDRLAERNRRWFRSRNICALNIVSSPGSGKTTLLTRTIRDRGAGAEMTVIEGDQATVNDARRIQEAGGRAVQINTGSGCHLEAEMVARGLLELAPGAGSYVLIENVGNLVCPALFDLGEQAKVAVLSVTEGTDKPAKYPHMFRAASLMIVNKIDLAPYVDFDVNTCIALAREVNPHIEVIQVSATRGDGLDRWYSWLQKQQRGQSGEARS